MPEAPNQEGSASPRDVAFTCITAGMKLMEDGYSIEQMHEMVAECLAAHFAATYPGDQEKDTINRLVGFGNMVKSRVEKHKRASNAASAVGSIL